MSRLLNARYLTRLLGAFMLYTALVVVFFALGNMGAEMENWLGKALLVSVGSFVVFALVVNFASSISPAGRLYNRAREQLRMGNHYAAATLYDHAVRADPGHAEYYYGRAEARQLLGDIRGALIDYAATIDATPMYLPIAASVAYDAYLARANIYAQQLGDYQSALRESSNAIAMYPRRDAAYLTRADAHSRLSNLPAALADLDKAVELDPQDPVIYNNRGFVHYLRGDLPAAEHDLLRATQLNAGIWQPHYHLAQVYAALGDHRRAMLALQQATSLNIQAASQAHLDAAFANLRNDTAFAQLTAPRNR